ncbi:Tetratricopeptide repeat-like superfamily protein, putative isoform 1 [Hibiscus syriacus]|uniref:Tetratricopeptide repeat-like superfamily protein, putative isoform 1 n=1 Tax=Hibiscus syriacus TaxID=106335 RepID=A0A6A3BGF1_HIBSY|nr:uncharacterized protein LOC120215841 [Hibiscus syriacus]KAE8716210.1 Tetratricopeptide repeat-like superfamily protein, putative isoform 1 [Hibiscus syriacus]
MSLLQYPDLVNVSTLHVWNNEAFDDGGSEDTTTIKISFSDIESVPVNRSLESDCGKENLSPPCLKSCVSFKRKEEEKRDEKKIDMEIEATEKEIALLSLKLETLRHEKAECKARRVSMRGRTVASKFMVQKQSTKNFEKMIEAPLFSSAKTKLNRAVDLATPMQSRRKSCFYKLRDLDEEKVKSRKGKSLSLSLSPKSRRTISKAQVTRPAATTVASKRAVKKEDGVLTTIQPKNLFKEGERSVTAKKPPPKQGRVVASRYNQIANQSNRNLATSIARKRSLTENDEESNRHGKRLAFREETMESCKNQKNKSRVN